MGYVNVIIDNSSNQTDQFYTYSADLSQIGVGDKVFVPFARGNKLRTAYVFEVSETAPEGISRIRAVDSKDPEVSLTPEALEVCRWMKERYFCRYIDAIKCFIPAGNPSKRGKARRPELIVSEEKTAVPELTREQSMAMARIRPSLLRKEHRTFVVRGVTGSGKTELYMRIVQECLMQGRTALVLVPEISLTDQIVSRFLDRFGQDEVAVLHSKLSQGQRYDEWMRLKQGQARIVIGARSAVFAPLSNVGAVILDEEHETTYKSDMTPKYDTAEVAEQLALLHKAVLILGSATPSLVSTYKAEQGEYEEILLKERYNKNPLPAVEVMDMREELKAGNRSIFSRALFAEMQTCLAEGRQVILFLNRRGYSTFLSCRECGYVVRCPECGISMTYHRHRGEAVCHYCGRHMALPENCPSCKGPYLRQFGAGTEKVEELTRQAFPEAEIERMDLDTVKKKGSAAAILNRFRKGKTQILIGTQLVAKGLDFRNVGLVGVISADVSLNIPDYRSPERTFQLITQAAGRAGRGDMQGRVIIQTYTPDHYAVTTAAEQDYEAFYREEIFIRKQLQYPPFSDLIQFVVAAEDENEAASAGQKIREAFLRKAGQEHAPYILGPHEAPINKVNGYYRQQLLLKVLPENLRLYTAVIDYLRKKVTAEKDKVWLFSADINPYSFL